MYIYHLSFYFNLSLSQDDCETSCVSKNKQLLVDGLWPSEKKADDGGAGNDDVHQQSFDLSKHVTIYLSFFLSFYVFIFRSIYIYIYVKLLYTFL